MIEEQLRRKSGHEQSGFKGDGREERKKMEDENKGRKIKDSVS